MFIEAATWLVDKILSMGYFGIVVLMALESSFFPFPSEIIMIPAGFLASQGLLNIYLVIIMGILGSLLGAYFNYWLADKYGRDFLHKKAKYFFTSKEKLEKIEVFFRKHGAFSTFFGRLIPVVRQYISFPAGLAKMNRTKFLIYTGLGAGIWVIFLTYLGYFIGENKDLISQYLWQFTIYTIFFILIIAIVYFTAEYKLYKKGFVGRRLKGIRRKYARK
jgi:membrane protein DedA with SNARE-associated domain